MTMTTEKPRRWTPKQIQALMDRRGWQSLDLAYHLGVTQETVRRWLRGTKVPRRIAKEALTRLCESSSTPAVDATGAGE